MLKFIVCNYSNNSCLRSFLVNTVLVIFKIYIMQFFSTLVYLAVTALPTHSLQPVLMASHCVCSDKLCAKVVAGWLSYLNTYLL